MQNKEPRSWAGVFVGCVPVMRCMEQCHVGASLLAMLLGSDRQQASSYRKPRAPAVFATAWYIALLLSRFERQPARVRSAFVLQTVAFVEHARYIGAFRCIVLGHFLGRRRSEEHTSELQSQS